MVTAFLFPGQGSQYLGMGAKLYESSETARRVFRAAEEKLGYDLAELCRQGPVERLNLTEYTQPAILTVSIAALSLVKERGLSAAWLAGHSLGEYSALVASGSLEFSEAVSLVRDRGRYMQEAVPAGTGAMAAILGLDRARIDAICATASAEGVVSPANFNSPVQIVIGGEKKAVEVAMALAKESGAKRVIPLAVSAPSHCALMEPAAERLGKDLREISLLPLKTPVVTNVDAIPIYSGELAKEALIRQLARPVQWVKTIERLVAEGVTAFIEIGPGSVLSGLVKRIAKGSRIYHVEDPDTLEIAVRDLASG